MARVRFTVGNSIEPVAADCTVGRSPACRLVATGRLVSGTHCRIVWTGLRWTVRDLGSKNGTFVDGQLIPVGEPVTLHVGSAIGLGSPETDFELIDDAAPGIVAVPVAGGPARFGTQSFLCLPTDDEPLLSLYPVDAGWVAEDDQGVQQQIREHSVVTAGSIAYRIELPGHQDATPMAEFQLTLSNTEFEFAVSPDEERVEIGLVGGGTRQNLGPREHNYFLLTLARARQEDAESPAAEQGWRSVDKLSTMLRIDPATVNVLTHRARQQLAGIIHDSAGIVEVRRGQRRLGTSRFSIRVAPN